MLNMPTLLSAKTKTNHLHIGTYLNPGPALLLDLSNGPGLVLVGLDHVVLQGLSRLLRRGQGCGNTG